MPQTDPFHSLVPRKMTDSELARAIRLDLEAELDAVNLYAAHIDATDNEDAKRVIRHVMNEEKEHAALFFELLKRLDPEQAEEAAKADTKYRLLVAGASDEEVEAAEEAGEGGAEPPEPAVHQLTVGGLRRPRG
ncbi:demethoxyubiquinone hydroxylase family protein [Vulgatibacter sp.]|uniref:demethoxyubiquinone hydroxylase family protein n=1 Tax=Vulgatibacter sp. TaxID=1971226 RepID=UPI003563397F